MKLTNYMRDAFIRRVMDDVPLRLAVDDEHEGDLACADVVRAAACFGVALEETQ